jgi:WD40 repeat protein
LASGSEDTTVILWDVQKGQRRSEPFGGYPQAVTSVAFSPDGHTLVSGSADPSIIILRTVATGQIIARPLIGQDRQDAVTSVTFSPDGHTLVLGSADGTITLLDVKTGKPAGQPFSGHQGAVTSMAFSRDGRTLALGGCGEGGKEVRGFRQCTRGDIRLWDMDTRQPIGQMLSDHQQAVTSVAFSPDGQTLVSSSRNNTIILWDLRFESWRSLACDLVARNLTPEEWRQYLGKEPGPKTCPDLP